MKTQILFFISFIFSISLSAQNKTGVGNVSDNATGMLIPNAIVQISPGSDTTQVFEYVCDKNGNYAFDITSDDSVYVLNIFPSEQTLQFTHHKENISLSNGDNGILYHNVELTGSNGIRFTVNDTAGNPVANAKVVLYNTQSNWQTDSYRMAKAVYTNADGQVLINSLLPIKYWFHIRKDYLTNAFTTDSTDTAIDTANTTNITVTIRDLTQNEFYMCGLCDNKTWITDSMIVYGITLPYDADTKLLSDGTWWDSNGRYGYWWFNEDETVMTYNYLDGTAGGTLIDATNLTITDSTWVGDMDFNGIPVTYFMSVHYPDTINLSISVRDTTIYLDDNGVAYITPDDLFFNSTYCFTCNMTLSQDSFNTGDIGDVEVYVTMEDRCGNSATDTLTVTVATTTTTAVNEVAKSGIIIYPNPANGLFHIFADTPGIHRVRMFNLQGRLVLEDVFNGQAKHTIDPSGLSQGLYFVSITGPQSLSTLKVMIR